MPKAAGRRQPFRMSCACLDQLVGFPNFGRNTSSASRHHDDDDGALYLLLYHPAR